MNKKLIIGSVVGLLAVGISSAFIFRSNTENTVNDLNSVKTNGISMPRYTSGNIEVSITTVPAVPQVGDNALIIELRDKDGKLIPNADIQAVARMPAMGTMPEMYAPAGLEEVSPGRYEGEMNLSMRGEWPLTVEIGDESGSDQRLLFELATDRPGLEIASGGVQVGGSATTVQAENTIRIDNRRRQLIGVEYGKVAYRDLTKTIQAVGKVKYDERLLSHVTLKYDGFIGDLKADYVGADIKKNQILFTVYSPELLAAQQEYLETLKRRKNQKPDDPLLRAARQRLSLWDMSDKEIKQLEQQGIPKEYVAIHAPRSGTLIENSIADGGAAPMGKMLLSIADLSKVWIEADVFEADLSLIKLGMKTTVSLPYSANKKYEGTVEYIYPYLEGQSRTGKIRLTLDNSDGLLKPEMFANVLLEADLGQKLSVPEEAVIFAGNSRIVFVDLEDGRLKPVRIKTGKQAGGFIEILGGLEFDETVVTSGNFLIAAETRLKTGIKQW